MHASKVSVTKFLGVMIDDELTWKHHIDLVKSKLSRSCAIMYRASFLIDRLGMHVLYCTHFSCHILCIVLKYGVTHTQKVVNVYLCVRNEL